ncbi:MAG TPA: hypothetical protein VHL98_20835 [Microvirga sp.]|jgi:hypothetical protein|nr:hypothetical protein [Microvirga sp.]
MGELRIQIDDAVLAELSREAEALGISLDEYARFTLQRSVRPAGDRSAVARRILATQPQKADIESVVFIREDRDRR